jgi:serine/threonine protein kinase
LATQSSDGELAQGTILAGRYRVERQLGKGGMGSVHLVQHVHTDQLLALKLLHATVVSDELALTRFRREARAPARITSDHVVQVTDADVAPELGGVPFLVMEWLRGQSLEDLCAERGVLPPADVALYLRQAARALDKAHGLGIVHRDLKPENLFLTAREDGTPCVKILDFGIAKLTGGDESERLKATGTGQIFGTPLYMSPEQTKAESDKIGPQTDVWALGIIAYRLLAGREPWKATTLTALVAQIAYEPLPVPSQQGADFGPAFDAWFARCCAREPKDRFPSAGEAIAALGQALDVIPEPRASGRELPTGPVLIARPREEVGQTAFSATAPASSLPSLGASAAAASTPARGGRARIAIGVAVALVAGIGTVLVLQATQGRPASKAASPALETAAPPITAVATALAAPPPPAPPPTVAPVETTAPAASASADAKAAVDRKPARPASSTPRAVAPPASTPAAKAAPPAPQPPSPPTDDPLGTRH